MKHLTRIRQSVAGVVLAVLLLLSAAPANAAAFSSNDRWAHWTDGTYTVYSNGWGDDFTHQDFWVNSATDWGVWSQQNATSGVQAYPNVTREINQPIWSLSHVSSNFSVTDPAGGAYVTAYDIWTADNAYEIMIWTNPHNVSPLGVSTGFVTLGGRNYEVFSGSNGANIVYSFVDTVSRSSGPVDVLAILRWLQYEKGWMNNQTLGKVQFGWEISTANPGQNFALHWFDVSFW